MTSATEPRPMCFTLRRIRPLGDSGGKSRCGWTVYSYPDLALLCDGRIIGDLEKAEGMARTAITAMGGTLEFLWGARPHRRRSRFGRS